MYATFMRNSKAFRHVGRLKRTRGTSRFGVLLVHSPVTILLCVAIDEILLCDVDILLD